MVSQPQFHTNKTKVSNEQTLTSSNALTPFVDFYKSHNISPVSQDIHDLQRHYGRRRSLYRMLGLVPRFVRGLDVLELGPGSGHNSIYTQSLGPQHYTLVDGNPVGLEAAKELFREHFPGAANISYVLSLVEDYTPDRRFDLVLCEGTIPFQLNPGELARTVGNFVADGGVLVITCADSVSIMGECVRRLIASFVSPETTDTMQRVAMLRPIFSPHLATLKGASRPIDDWLLDNIIHPLIGQTFSIPEAIASLALDDFEFYGSSPSFTSDWRWYKNIVPGSTFWNEKMSENYQRHILNFLDYRFERPPHSAEFGTSLQSACDAFYTDMQRFESGIAEAFAEAVETLERIIVLIDRTAPETAEALREALNILKMRHIDPSKMLNFSSFFGRGQQYVSFIKSQA